jgi:hypothetical protein
VNLTNRNHGHEGGSETADQPNPMFNALPSRVSFEQIIKDHEDRAKRLMEQRGGREIPDVLKGYCDM